MRLPFLFAPCISYLVRPPPAPSYIHIPTPSRRSGRPREREIGTLALFEEKKFLSHAARKRERERKRGLSLRQFFYFAPPPVSPSYIMPQAFSSSRGIKVIEILPSSARSQMFSCSRPLRRWKLAARARELYVSRLNRNNCNRAIVDER